MFKRWKRILLAIAGMLLVLFGVAMFDPFFQQLTFGPRFGGAPLTVWQGFFRDWAAPQKSAPPTFLDTLHESVSASPSPPHWKRLPGEDRREVLLTLVREPSDRVRMYVAMELRQVSNSASVVAALKRLATDDSGAVRREAGYSLGQLDPPATDAIPELLAMLSSVETDQTAQFALGNIGSKAPDAVVPELMKMVRSPSRETRLTGVAILGQVRPAVKEAISTLIETLRDPDPMVRELTLQSLSFVKAQAAIPEIIAATVDPDVGVRRQAYLALARFGPSANAAIPRLIEHVEPAVWTSDESTASAIMSALGAIGPESKDAIPRLLKLRDHRSETIRNDVEKTLSQIDATRFPPKENAKDKK